MVTWHSILSLSNHYSNVTFECSLNELFINIVEENLARTFPYSLLGGEKTNICTENKQSE